MMRCTITIAIGVALGLSGCSSSSSSSPAAPAVEPATPPTAGSSANLGPGGPNKATEPRVERGTPADRKLLAEVSARLLGVCPKVTDQEWPPEFAIDGDDVRAYAGLRDPDAKKRPVIAVSPDLMAKVVEGDANRLALILGHELGHHLARHLLTDRERANTRFLKATFSRADEFEADRLGAELVLKAQYSLPKGLVAFAKMQDLGFDTWTFRELGDPHPNWNDRRKAIDKDRAQLWQSMGEFSNGVSWLAVEGYAYAELCFDSVVREFPEIAEAWANLGFAKLMQYCDKLEERELLQLGIGQVVGGGYYKRIPTSRGSFDKELWVAAVNALNQAEKRSPGQTRVLANLGLAYLVAPPEQQNGETAAGFLQRAIRNAKEHIESGPAWVNLAAALQLNGENAKCLDALAELEKLVPNRSDELKIAASYTRALVLAESTEKADRAKAFQLFKEYLGSANSLSHWWAAAYTRYCELAKDLGITAKEKSAITRGIRPVVRYVTGVSLKSGARVSLGDSQAVLAQLAGPSRESLAVPLLQIRRVQSEAEGLEFIVTDKVIAISVVGPEASIPIRGAGPASANAGELRIGMAETALVALLGQTVQNPEILTPNVRYLYYREQGLAVRVAAGKVVEIMVVQLPSD